MNGTGHFSFVFLFCLLLFTYYCLLGKDSTHIPFLGCTLTLRKNTNTNNEHLPSININAIPVYVVTVFLGSVYYAITYTYGTMSYKSIIYVNTQRIPVYT